MKLYGLRQRNLGMTLLEAVVVIFLLFMLAVVLVPALVPVHRKGGPYCANSLKQVGVAFQTWAEDHNNTFPTGIPAQNGGAMEAAASGRPRAVFQVMSNELSTPKILICPEDKHRHAAADFNVLTCKNISYFTGLGGKPGDPQSILSGDDNFEIGRTRVRAGLLEISTNTPLEWSPARHQFYGNILFADGSVQGMNNVGLKNWRRSTNFTNVRLAIP
jgi:prepilin-type processing-associated H-X9-DG protein